MSNDIRSFDCAYVPRSPIGMPTAVPSTPSSSASQSSISRRLPRCAPTNRSNASSRRLCTTVNPKVVLTMNTVRKTASITVIPSNVAAPAYPSRMRARSIPESPGGNCGRSVAAITCNADCTSATPSATATTAPANNCHRSRNAPHDNLSMPQPNRPNPPNTLPQTPYRGSASTTQPTPSTSPPPRFSLTRPFAHPAPGTRRPRPLLSPPGTSCPRPPPRTRASPPSPLRPPRPPHSPRCGLPPSNPSPPCAPREQSRRDGTLTSCTESRAWEGRVRRVGQSGLPPSPSSEGGSGERRSRRGYRPGRR